MTSVSPRKGSLLKPQIDDSTKSWSQSPITTARGDGVVARLNKTWFRSAEARGRETQHQVGIWVSDTLRPHGRMRYGEATEFTPITRLNYVPAGVAWVAQIDHQPKPRPALYCDFDEELFRSVSGIEADGSPAFLNMSLRVDSAKLHQAMWLLLEEVQNPGFAHHIALESLGRVILVELGRCFHSQQFAPSKPSGSLASWQMDRLTAYVEDVEGKPLVIADIAELCGVSASHLRRLFKATTGTTISAYVESKRIARARSMLADRRVPLKEIAFRLGFSSPASFSTAFRRAAGMTPMRFRQIMSS